MWDEVVNNTQSNPIQVHESIDAVELPTFNKKDIKARRIILDVVKNHVIPHLTTKTHAHLMWVALTNLY